MSRYFQTLKKLQQQQGDDIPEPAEPSRRLSPPPEAQAPIWEPETPAEVFPELPLAHREAAWGHMLEALRAESHSAQPILVVAGVSDVESTHRLVIGLRKQAARKGVTVRAARLTQSQEGRLLSFLPDSSLELESPRKSDDSAENPAGPSAVGGFDLTMAQTGQQLSEWLRTSSSGSDMLIIEAPGVLSSADTVLLAKACDGLAVVVEPMITDRSALRTAVGRAQTSGCRIVGLIVNGHRDWLPRWLRRLLSDS